jgi:hypothetical protein
LYNLCNQVHSLAPLIKARYLASIEERVIVGYFFEHHVTTLIPIVNTYLVVECQLSLYPIRISMPLKQVIGPLQVEYPKIYNTLHIFENMFHLNEPLREWPCDDLCNSDCKHQVWVSIGKVNQFTHNASINSGIYYRSTYLIS